MQIAKIEISDLVYNGVLVQGIESSWKSSFFRKKKDGGIRFVSDLRKLNKEIERDAFPLPVIDDVIWKMNRFQFATCLDLNRSYHHFVLSPNSRKLLSIILPCGNFCYARMPQGLKISGDIFQERMTTYIDNNILYTKKDFDHYLQRLEQVLFRLQENDIHVHVEDTSLASKKCNYLGYTLPPKGIQPQINKIIPILRLARPKNRKLLRSFLGLINYYKNYGITDRKYLNL